MYSFPVVFLPLFVIFLPSVISQSVSVVPVNYELHSSCNVDDFYQPGNLSCVMCESDAVQSEDGLSCQCNDGYFRNLFPSQCKSCDIDQVVSNDGLFCLECTLPLVYNNGICSECNFTSIFVDTLPLDQAATGSRSCTPCPQGTWADPTQTSCIPCGIEDCTECVGSKVTGGVCFFSPLSSPSSHPFNYYNDYYSSALELCNNGNGTACQLLLNLCVLQYYSKSDSACEESIKLASTQPDLVPPLFYPEFGADEYLDNTVINTEYSTRTSDSSSKLRLVASQFSLNGSFLGLINITDEIMLCRDRPSRLASALQIGVQYELECTIDSDQLIDDGLNPMFYDIFLLDQSSSDDYHLLPLPILVDNYRDDSGTRVNKESNTDKWQFVRRIFLSQSVTDSPSYAKSIHLRIILKSGGHIQIPYLRINYDSLPSNTKVSATFSTLYKHNGNDFNIGLGVTASILVVIATVYTGLKMNGHLRREGSTLCELQTFLFMIAEFCSVTSTLFLLLLTISSCFLLVLFKAQLTLFITLPQGNQEIAFITLLVLAFVFRLIHNIYLIWRQVTIQIFLVDWERPRGLLNTGNQNSELATSLPQTPVSIWRTYFIANEWNEIQSLRKISPVLVLLTVLLFLDVIGLRNLSERDPSSHVTTPNHRYSAPHSLVLRFGLMILFYVIFAVMLRLYMVLIHERFVEHKIRQFVDLCSISNVSVFILSHGLYGYYIHGRSVHGHADTNMKQMNQNLIKEKDDMCGRRGLIPDTDEQIFEIAITPTFRTQYFQILAPILAARAEGQTNVRSTHTEQGNTITETSLKSYEDMNHFLSSFLEHSVPDCDYVVKTKLLLEKIFGMEFHDAVDKCLLYTDSDNSFAGVLFYGHEWSLLTYDVLLFGVVDLAAGNFVLAAIITYLSIQLLKLVRDGLGKRNLGRRTLVDEKFLI